MDLASRISFFDLFDQLHQIRIRQETGCHRDFLAKFNKSLFVSCFKSARLNPVCTKAFFSASQGSIKSIIKVTVDCIYNFRYEFSPIFSTSKYSFKVTVNFAFMFNLGTLLPVEILNLLSVSREIRLHLHPYKYGAHHFEHQSLMFYLLSKQ